MNTEHHTVRVTFNNGDMIVSTINGSIQSIKDYYLNNEFVASDETTMRKVEHIEFYRWVGHSYKFLGEMEGIHECSGFEDENGYLAVNPRDYIGRICTVIAIHDESPGSDNLTYLVEF